MHPSDRIVVFQLEGDHRLEASFFGSSANVSLLRADNTVVESFKRNKEKTDHPSIPSSPRKGGTRSISLPYDSDMLTLAAGEDESVSVVLKRHFSHLGPVLVREILFRSSLAGTTHWGKITDGEKTLLSMSLKEVGNELGNIRPRIYTLPDGGPEFAIIPLKQHEDCREERFEDIHDAIRAFMGKEHSTRNRENKHDLMEKRLKTILEKASRTAEAMEQDRASSERPMEYERFGKLILANLAVIKQGMDHITLSAEGTAVSIPLQRELTPAANAQRYFEKAKRSRTARKQTGERLTSITERIVLLRSLLDELSSQSDFSAFLEGRSKDLEILGLSEKQAAVAELPFRVYHVEGGFEVWAGKNSKSNDELTMKHARPNDLWFHARGAGGSHVILRVSTAKGEPGKRARRQAASVAAFFSKMKGAKMVPVAMTQRKYVRKPKGAPPGTVIIEREEVIITEPRLPEEK